MGMGIGMEAICAGMDGEGNRVLRGRLGMGFKFVGTDGDGDELSSPCSSLVRTMAATSRDRNTQKMSKRAFLCAFAHQ